MAWKMSWVWTNLKLSGADRSPPLSSTRQRESERHAGQVAVQVRCKMGRCAPPTHCSFIAPLPCNSLMYINAFSRQYYTKKIREKSQFGNKSASQQCNCKILWILMFLRVWLNKRIIPSFSLSIFPSPISPPLISPSPMHPSCLLVRFVTTAWIKRAAFPRER